MFQGVPILKMFCFDHGLTLWLVQTKLVVNGDPGAGSKERNRVLRLHLRVDHLEDFVEHGYSAFGNEVHFVDVTEK